MKLMSMLVNLDLKANFW